MTQQNTVPIFKPPKRIRASGSEYIVSNSKIAYDLLDIEEFLNGMISTGLRPTRVRWGTQYRFVPCVPGEFVCRTAATVTRLGGYDRRKAAELGELLACEGAVIIRQENTWGSRMGIIALRPAALGPFELNTDLDSHIAEYETRRKYCLGASFAYLVPAVLWIIVSLLPAGIRTGLPIALIFLLTAAAYYRPVPRYGRIIARLKALRNVSEI